MLFRLLGFHIQSGDAGADLADSSAYLWLFYQMVVAAGGTRPHQVFVRASATSGMSSDHRETHLHNVVVSLDHEPFCETATEPLEAYQGPASLHQDSEIGAWSYLNNEMVADAIFVKLNRNIKRIVILELQYIWRHGATEVEHISKILVGWGPYLIYRYSSYWWFCPRV